MDAFHEGRRWLQRGRQPPLLSKHSSSVPQFLAFFGDFSTNTRQTSISFLGVYFPSSSLCECECCLKLFNLLFRLKADKHSIYG